MTYFPDLLRARAVHEPHAIAYSFYQGPTLVPEDMTVRELWERAASLAHDLQEQQLEGERVVLVCKSQKNFVVAFFACMLAGAIVVPTAAPRRQMLYSRLQLLAADAGARALIADSDDVLAIAPQLAMPACLDMRVQMAGSGHAAGAARWRRPQCGGATPAFLQYTSGSTGEPKGVIVSHTNLLQNCRNIAEAMQISAHSAILTALPLFHDMGLVGGVLVGMFAGCRASFMLPAEFVQYPERWLTIIGTAGITHSGGPNFMYDLVARAVDPAQLAGCDLSRWRVAYCGAEPIRAATVGAFARQFAALGFRPDAFYPCYGMAEATLLITGHAWGTLPRIDERDGMTSVSCGAVAGDGALAIVDPDTLQAVRAGAVGEIWARGASIAHGYWGRPALSAHVFGATLAGQPDTRWLRTGDLGYQSDGQLYVSGRLKDVVIVYGKKYAPNDLEYEAERSHAALASGGGAAFNVAQDDGSRVVMVFEVKREWMHQPDSWPGVAAAMRSAVSSAHGVQIDDIVLLRPTALPRTSSGKVRRSQCRSDYLAGRLPALAGASPTP